MIVSDDFAESSSSCQKLVIQLPGLMFCQSGSFANLDKTKCFQQGGAYCPCTVNKGNILWSICK